MRSFRRVALLVCLLLCFPVHLLAAPASSLIPLDSWVYPALDKLEGLGLIESSLQGMRPYTRLEAARQLEEALQNADSETTAPVVDEILRQLKGELHDELTEVRGEAVPSADIHPIRQFDARYVYQNGEPSLYPNTNASQYALNTNNFGLEYSDGSNADFRLLGDARLAKIFQLEWRPVILSSGDDAFDLALLEGRAAVELGPVEFSVGRQAIWWGQGRHGTLLLTNNAEPLDMVRITNPLPMRLPWIFKYLGPFRFDAFWSRLDKDRVVPEPYLAGVRLNFKPLPEFEFGATRTIMFGGEGRPSVDLPDFITILFGETRLGDNDNSNSLASLDWRIKMPVLWDTELYGELGGEDQLNYFFTKKALMLGLYLPKIEPSQRLGLRFEYADLNYSMGSSEGNGPVWYRHSVYQSGYTYENHILGHHVGGDSRDYYAAMEWYVNSKMNIVASCDIEQRGYSQIVREKHVQPGLSMQWRFNPHVMMGVDFYYDRIKNFDYAPGNDVDNYLARLDMSYSW